MLPHVLTLNIIFVVLVLSASIRVNVKRQVSSTLYPPKGSCVVDRAFANILHLTEDLNRIQCFRNLIREVMYVPIVHETLALQK